MAWEGMFRPFALSAACRTNERYGGERPASYRAHSLMKKTFLFILLCLTVSLSPAQFRRAIFLHHSVGGVLWDRSQYSDLLPPTTLPAEITAYNNRKGYTGGNAVSMSETYFPAEDAHGSANNNWYVWDILFSGGSWNGSTISSYYSSYPIIIVKTCYLETQDMGSPDSIAALKVHWRHILTVMKNHPSNFFVIWTNYPAATDGHSDRDAYSNTFSKWAKDTLAAGNDSFGAFPSNVYVFDVFHKLASPIDGYCDPQYGSFSEGPGGDHPSNAAVAILDPVIIQETFDAAIAHARSRPGTLMLTLTVTQGRDRLTGLYDMAAVLGP